MPAPRRHCQLRQVATRAVNFPPIDPAQLHPVAGVTLGWAEANIRKPNRKDVLVISVEEGATVGGVFTSNRFCAAPVTVCREHLDHVRAGGKAIRALVVNTGNANAGTGEPGLAHARETCVELARLSGIAPEQVLPFSTGVILEPLPVDRLKAGLPAALENRRGAHWYEAAQSIMTTDTLAKAVSRQVTIDGDTSTNDSFILIASGKSSLPAVASTGSPAYAALRDAVTEVAQTLAQLIVRDGEGATKFMTVQVEGGSNVAECRQIAYAIGHSPLVKTAFYASDPNLGRILAAIGYAGVADLDVGKIDLYLDDVLVARAGGRNPEYREEDGQRVMKKAEILIRVVLGRGDAHATIWTCDLSHEYVSINADYRS